MKYKSNENNTYPKNDLLNKSTVIQMLAVENVQEEFLRWKCYIDLAACFKDDNSTEWNRLISIQRTLFSLYF